MLGIGDVERDERVRFGHGLKPVVAGEHGDTAILPLEPFDERRARGVAVETANEIESTVERVDVRALPVRQEQWLSGELLFVAARTWRERDASEKRQVGQSPQLYPWRRCLR